MIYYDNKVALFSLKMLSFRSHLHCEKWPILLEIAVCSQLFALRKFTNIAWNWCLFAIVRTAKIHLFWSKSLSFRRHSHCENWPILLKTVVYSHSFAQYFRSYLHCENAPILLETIVFSQSFALRKFIYFARKRCLFAGIRTAKIDLFFPKPLSVRIHSHCENSPKIAFPLIFRNFRSFTPLQYRYEGRSAYVNKEHRT